MTVAVNFTTVIESISNLDFGNITVKDITEIPVTGSLITPVLFPQPDGFISDVNMTFESFGTGGAATMDLTYTLNYVFAQSEVGGGLGAYDGYSDLVVSLAKIMKIIFENDAVTGAVDIKLQGVPTLGVISDPVGKKFWGVLLSLKVLEYVQ